MPPPEDMLEKLLEDAKRVAAYGQRSGRLRDNELTSAIAAVHRMSAPLQWRDPEAVALQSALDRAINNIAPTTLADLNDADWEPFSPKRSDQARRTQLGFIVFSLVLLLFTGFSTVVYNKGAAIVSEIDKLLVDEPRAAIATIVRQLNSNPAILAASTEVAADETYTSLIEQLQTYDDRYSAYQSRANRFLGENPLPHDLLGYWWIRFSDWVSGVKRNQTQYRPCDANGDLVLGPTAAASTGNASEGGAKALPPVANQADLPGRVKQTRLLSFQIFCAQGLNSIDFGLAGYMSYSAELQWWINAWGLLYLPALYGAFGATLYYMRRILDPTLPDPTIFHFIHRVALGAFAGVIVTWFWAPNNALTTGFTSVGLTLFTVAFIIGFSVDILFAILDRFVNAALGIVKGTDRRTHLSAPIYVSPLPPESPGAATAPGGTPPGPGGLGVGAPPHSPPVEPAPTPPEPPQDNQQK